MGCRVLLSVREITGHLLVQATGCSSAHRQEKAGLLSSEQVNCVLYYFLCF
jgi:hypothetical protein